MSYYQYYQAPQPTVIPTAGGYYPQGQPLGYATTGTGGYTIAGGAMMQQPVSAYGQPLSAYGQQPLSAYGQQPMSAYGQQPMSAYGQPVQYVQAQPTYYPGGQFAYSQNGAATYAYANPPPMHMSQYPAGFAGGVQYIQPTPTGYGQVQPQTVVLTGGTQMGMPVQTIPGQPTQYVQYY
ncbi:hypothetical protein FRC04_004814 [Tulasnella sp. 424]|nr:hypothetical protein FRC04_004814 [Tulasnella sp. 424]KAG8965143.1 hypothetical protein FRC05_003355 [Tulasnella sp. 425]